MLDVDEYMLGITDFDRLDEFSATIAGTRYMVRTYERDGERFAQVFITEPGQSTTVALGLTATRSILC